MAGFGFDDDDDMGFEDLDVAPAGYGHSTSSTSTPATGGTSHVAAALASLPAKDTIEQHALHSIFADGVASEVPSNV